MKILALSDEVVERIYSLCSRGYFDDIDLILGCGDLPYDYLENLLTLLNVPLLYVPGNHDPIYRREEPLTYVEGGSNLDLKSVLVKRLRIAGFGGSVRYRPSGTNQYTQSEAYLRASRLAWRLLWGRLIHRRILDVLITHSPPYGIHDEDTQAHRGLKAINWLLRVAKPRYHLHGHTHFHRQNISPSETNHAGTLIMNIYPYKIIEVEH